MASIAHGVRTGGPAGEAIHVILDNYAAHKHPKVLAWLARHPCWAFHFTPTSGSWLNAVENFFTARTRRRPKRGVFRSIVEPQAAINRYLAEHNEIVPSRRTSQKGHESPCSYEQESADSAAERPHTSPA